MAASAALHAVAGRLACPICGAPMTIAQSVVCANRHSFDIARQGYVSFLVGTSPHAGDTGEMVAARADFLAAGHYEPIALAVSRAVGGASGLVVEIAAGTGYYLARVLDDHPRLVGLALDVSTAAARRAARAHPRAAAATADAWRRLPIGDRDASAAITVFGPRNGAELARILEPGGVAVVVTPTPDHMRELRERFGLIAIQDDKDARLDAQLGQLRLAARDILEYQIELGPVDVLNEIFMGPSAFHLDRDTVLRQLDARPAVVTVSVTVSVFVRDSV
jgi:23S rRNA (guanine745-N1)-methyltransferase